MKFILIVVILLCGIFPVYTQSNLDFADSVHSSIYSEREKLKISLQEQDINAQLSILKNIGNSFQLLNEFDSSIHYYTHATELAQELSDMKAYSSLVYNLGIVYLRKGSYPVALDYALKGLETDRRLNNTEDIAASLNSVALIYQEWGIYDKALEYRFEAIEYSILSNNRVEIANGHFNLGSLYQKIGKPEKALEFFLKSRNSYLDLLAKNPNDISIIQSVSEAIYSIGYIYLSNKEYQPALEYFNNALETKTSLGDKAGIANCYNQIGFTHLLTGDYSLALDNFRNALPLKYDIGDKKGIAIIYYRLALTHFEQGMLNRSETFFNKSINVASEIEDYQILGDNYRKLYEIYSGRRKFKEALEYHEKFKAFGDSVKNENNTKIIEELNISYETEKKEQENNILVRDNEIKELTIKRQRSMGYYLVGTIILVLAIVVILYILYLSKQKANKIISETNIRLGLQNKKIAEQKKEIEQKNQDMTDSLLYAKRIQESMLVDVKKLNEILDEAFIYFKPKDIVSGDFYWFGQKDDKFIISAIDCTGHGVPGAFMSMLGNTFLNQIIHNQGITSPEKILTQLSKEVQLGLKQAETNNQDGMDMALCTIDLKTKKLEYAGAKNPLIYIQDGTLVRIKADRLPIGISLNEDGEFHKYGIEIKSSTCFYMFSDGYIDQFGGPTGGKFMIKQFQNLLLKIHQEPMMRQGEIIDKTMQEWMKGEEQIDDILVVGFRIDA